MLLEIKNLEVVYSEVILVLKGINMVVPKGHIVALLGANGAGKSTTLKAISGLLHSEDGEVTSGSIEYDSVPIHRKEPSEIVRMGLVQVMEGRRVLEHMTLEQNLIVAGNRLKSRQKLNSALKKVYDYFPRLGEKCNLLSGYLSGGEQQMMVIGRALMAEPTLVLLDEPSLGLAPIVVREIFEMIDKFKKEMQTTFLLVEQNAMAALSIADYGYVLEDGRMVLTGTGEDLRENEDIKEFYLGMNLSGESKGFKDVKHYKRRKRWLG